MKRKWSWESDNEAWMLAGMLLWGVGWLPVFLVLCAIFDKHGLSGDVRGVPLIVLFSWIGGPFVLGALYHLPRGLRSLWRARPRRVWVNQDDMRKHYKDR